MAQHSNFCGSALLTPSDITGRLQISQRKLYYLVSEGEFPPPLKIGRLNRWREDHLITYFEALEEAASNAVESA